MYKDSEIFQIIYNFNGHDLWCMCTNYYEMHKSEFDPHPCNIATIVFPVFFVSSAYGQDIRDEDVFFMFLNNANSVGSENNTNASKLLISQGRVIALVS